MIAALHDSKAFADEHLEAAIRGSAVAKEKDEELRASSRVAREKIAKVIDMGAFLLSDQALPRLRQYLKDRRKEPEVPDWVGHLEIDLSATDACLKDLIRIAKTDLQIQGMIPWTDRGKHVMRWILMKFEQMEAFVANQNLGKVGMHWLERSQWVG